MFVRFADFECQLRRHLEDQKVRYKNVYFLNVHVISKIRDETVVCRRSRSERKPGPRRADGYVSRRGRGAGRQTASAIGTGGPPRRHTCAMWPSSWFSIPRVVYHEGWDGTEASQSSTGLRRATPRRTFGVDLGYHRISE